MRGFPLLHTLCLSIALTLVGLGFYYLLTGGAQLGSDLKKEQLTQSESPKKHAVFELIFSHPPSSHKLSVGNHVLELSATAENRFRGEGEIRKDLPIFIKSTPALPPTKDGRFFMKLIVEAEGEKTFTRVFDAEGAIDDFVELPF